MTPIEWFNLELTQKSNFDFMVKMLFIVFFQERGAILIAVFFRYFGIALSKYSNGLIKEPIDFINVFDIISIIFCAIFLPYFARILIEKLKQQQIKKNRFQKIMNVQ